MRAELESKIDDQNNYNKNMATVFVCTSAECRPQVTHRSRMYLKIPTEMPPLPPRHMSFRVSSHWQWLSVTVACLEGVLVTLGDQKVGGLGIFFRDLRPTRYSQRTRKKRSRVRGAQNDDGWPPSPPIVGSGHGFRTTILIHSRPLLGYGAGCTSKIVLPTILCT